MRFTRPVVVPDDGVGATLEVSGKVTELLDDKRVRVELTASSAGAKVLGQARAVVQLGVSERPGEVAALAQRRAEARTAKDFAASDALRDEIAATGWVVRDTADGLHPRAPSRRTTCCRRSPTCRTARPSRTSASATVSVLVEGWPDDVRTCLEALVAHLPAGVVVEALDLGNVDGAGDVLHELAQAHPGLIEELHVERPAGWAAGPYRAAQARRRHRPRAARPVDRARGRRAAPGPRGLRRPDGRRRRLARGQRRPRRRVALVRRRAARARSTRSSATCSPSAARAALAVGGPHPKARFYRNADMELSLMLREAGGRLVVPAGELPVRQDRHRGYHDSDPAYRDAESAKTYNRLLQRFRGRKEILAPRRG